MDQESELVQQAMAGDSDAAQQLLLSYYDRVLSFIDSRMPANISGALHPEDVLQQAYLKAFRSIGNFQPKSEYSFYGWLKTIAQRQLIDEIRKFEKDPMGVTAIHKAKRPGGSSTMVGVSVLLSDDDPLPDESANRAELVRATQVALASLDPQYQEAIRLRYFLNHSAEEVANELGVTPDALRGILFRARKKLKEEIGRLSMFV